MASLIAFIPDEIIPIHKPLFEGTRLLMAEAKGVGEEVRGRLNGRREEGSDVAIP